MTVASETFEVGTRGDADCIDITPDVERAAAGWGVRNGIVNVFVTGSTAALTTIEFEPGCVRDLGEMFQRIAPQGSDYHHHARWGDRNGHSHMRASLLGSHLAVPLVDGR